ncbi:hypothetical protein WJX64_13685 [Leifsonia sp. YIM 134122]|uniref:Uncharacterized protein n=1 Tax=Leifsonia stereocauli TaxID=3134136 RepID=A0ABU9W7J0_9MICO
MAKMSAVGAAWVAVASLLLVGCTSAPSSKPTTGPGTSTSDPSPTATPTEDAVPAVSPGPEAESRAAITRIVVRPEYLQFIDESGAELQSISYDDAADAYVELFTDLMGAGPDISDTPGGNESLPTTHYEWDGFVLRDDHESGDTEWDMNVSVTFTKAELGPRHIGVATTQGFQPGDDLGWLATYMNEPYDENAAFHQVQAEHGEPIGEQNPDNPYSNSNSVAGQDGFKQEGTVIFAPWNFGIGHV